MQPLEDFDDDFSSRILFSFLNTFPPLGLWGEALSRGSGKFFVSGVPAGKHDIIVTAEVQSSFFNLTNQKVGARVRGVEFLPGKRAEQAALTLPELKQLAGRVTLAGASDSAGIQVYIPGTEYSAVSDTQGQFQFQELPTGIHNFFFEKDGYHRGQIEGFEIQPQNSTHTLSDVHLILDTGVEGAMVLNGGASLSLSKTVSVTLAVPPEAVLMKISENENFEGASWKPLRTSFNHTFTTDGSKLLFAKVANANGLESSLFRSSVEVRSQPLTPILSFVDARCSAEQFKLSIKVSDGAPTAVKMRISMGTVNEETPWEDFSAEKVILKSTLTGPLTVEVKDAQGNAAKETMTAYDCIIATKEGRSGFSSAVAGSKLFIAGGSVPYPYHWSDELNVLDTSTNQLTTFQLAQAREAIKTAVVGSKVIFAGGGGNAGVWNNVEIYDLVTNTLTTTATLSQARSVGTAAVVGDTALFAGGFLLSNDPLSNYSKVVDIYNASSNTWNQAELSGSGSSASIVLGDKVLFYEASSNQNLTPLMLGIGSATVDIYDSTVSSEAARWTQASLSSVRSPTALVVNGKAVFAGGGGASGAGGVADVDIYDGASWNTASLSLGRTVGCTAVHENVAYFIGGSGASGSQRVDVYNSVSNAWSYFDMPNGVLKCETHVVDGAIYVFGFVINASYYPDQYIKIDTSVGNTVSGPHCPFCLTDPRPNPNKRGFSGLNGITFGTKIYWPTSAMDIAPGGGLLTYVEGRLDVLDTVTGMWTHFPLARPRGYGHFFKVGSKGVLVGGYVTDAPSSNHPAALDIISLDTGANESVVKVEL